MSQEESQVKLVFPESLVDLWKYAHGEASLPEEQAASLWKLVKRLVLKDANSRAQKFGLDNAEDLANDFVASLMSGSCPDEITAVGTLQKCAKKFWAEKWNPCGKEINDVVRCGLLELVKDGSLERSDMGKTIGKKTCFWLAGQVPERAAMPVECEQVFPKIKMVGLEARNYQTANKRLLTPTEAKRIVCDLLALLGGSRSVFMEEIMSCVLNRTRHVTSPFVERYDESGVGDDLDSGESPDVEAENGARELDAVQEIGAKNFTARLNAGMSVYAEDDDAADAPQEAGAGREIPDRLFDDERFLRRQLEVVSRKAAERIWTGVLKMHGDKVFCLYSLPTFCDVKTDVVMKDLGATSTVGDKHLKLKKLLQVELAFVIKNPDEYRFGPGNALQRITRGLIGRCAEKGHVVPL